jgi:hypothetical protein
LGLGEAALLAACNRDGDFCKGCDPDMTPNPSRTIMPLRPARDD